MTTSPPKSARISARAGRSELRPPNPPARSTDENDKKPRRNVPPVAVVLPNPPAQPGNNPPVAGRELPDVEGIQYEHKKDGSIEAWHTPVNGIRNRKGKTYLGRIGKRLMASWQELPPSEFQSAVTAWIAEKRAAANIG